ncbi:ABC transporter permease [Streptomyces alkaliterrae]|uniref:ABC transporter permease n=1 Tax=Streptomyces alkaliterrae TaxID=2213162 RepID=A0A5P0YYU9_9ACTN|nr:ABC transporter permease [Streptomyces alkaliterrae]MBB1256484.1 ABC transporter permease [Streptomyces alkaliterrae]MBB1258180.1 ABC transporter permease [Streptomyces alkaliterrae]MQS04732.1 ABC transporter permease subunit [Streptomyces alkaliterrae]
MRRRDSHHTPGAAEPEDAIGGAGSEIDLAKAEGETLEGREAPPRGLWADAWHDLRRRPIFIISALLIVFLVVISLWPSLIATRDPLDCRLARSLDGPTAGHWFGFDTQGCDVYTRTVYGARASVAVGVCATIGVALLGSLFGGLAGFFGGVWDALLSRITDIFFGIPLILGALVFLAMITVEGIWPVVAVITLLAWPQIARISRGAVLTAKQHDYVQAARALGASNTRMLLRHILPNAVAPVIVVATIALGTYIALEATLSFLAVGLKPPTVSWGVDISIASSGMQFRNAPHILLYPAGALSVTVLAFIMLGDAVRDALDPKLR